MSLNYDCGIVLVIILAISESMVSILFTFLEWMTSVCVLCSIMFIEIIISLCTVPFVLFVSVDYLFCYVKCSWTMLM